MSAPALLQMQDVYLTYRALPALRAINWRPLQGQQWALLGPNGAGKTSLANILSGVTSHYSGEFQRSPALATGGTAYVCFEQARALCDRDRKLDDSETRADATDPGTLVRTAILDGRQPDAEFQHWVTRLGLEAVLERGLRFISTGEMRKTLLLRAILSRPALLILDSPLDGLDQATQQTMREVIDELLASELHLLMLCRQTEDLADGISHVLTLDDGEILAAGERQQVLELAAVRQLMNPATAALVSLPPPAQRPYTVPSDQPLLALRQINVRYGDNPVLSDVDWTFEHGQHCCIAGPNGCGKTTLLSLVTGDNHKAYGQDITLFGQRRGSGESVWDIKQKYGQVDTQLHLNFRRGMKVLEVVVSGFFDSVGLFDDWSDWQRDSARQWLAALGLAAVERDSFDALSFGMQRMVLLARAMVKSPLILLLDEPTLGLDGHHRRLILRAIDHIATHSDTQVLFVSHSAGEMPACINQRLEFVPVEDGFRVQCSEPV